MGVLFISLVLLTGVTIALIGYYTVHKVEVSLTNELADNISHTILYEIRHSVYDPVWPLVNAMAQGMFPRVETGRERLPLLPIVQTFMRSYRIMGGIHVTYENGDYIAVRRFSPEGEKRPPGAPANSVYALAYMERDGRRSDRNWIAFYDKDFNVLRLLPNQLNANDDLRKHPWYQNALKATGQIQTGPFVIPDSGRPAMVFSERSPNGKAVVGITILLDQLSDFLGTMRPTPGTRIGLFQASGTLLANARGITKDKDSEVHLRGREDLSPIIAMGLRRYEQGERGLDIDVDVEGQHWVLLMEDLELAGAGGDFIVLAMPRDEIFDESIFFKRYVGYAAAGILIATALASWFAVWGVFRPLRKLAEKAQRLKDVPLDNRGERIVSGVAEIDALSRGMEHMQENIQRLFSITATINAEKDFTQLLRHVMNEAMDMCHANGGLIILLNDGEEKLREGIDCWAEKNGKFLHIPLSRVDLEKLRTAPRVLQENTLVHELIPRTDLRNKVKFLALDFEDPDATGVDMLSAPLSNRKGERLGIFILSKKINPGVECFRPELVSLIEGLAKSVAIAIENHRLFEKQRALLDAVIQIVAGAIDAKSPYTGGHCARVPLLFQMILRAACEEKEGVFEDFSLNDDGWEEARLAAWLHDWGKVTTPEYVMDKATKLETMYDRIHEIRTRFEVLKRDAEISCLRTILKGGDVEEETRKLRHALRELDEDFTFVACCNRGDERLSDEDLERLQRIGSRTWLSTLDKRLGVSRDERTRMEEATEPGASSIEKLLADKPEHIIERNSADNIAADNPWGLKIKTPQYLYNRGELHNLSIRTGTLTEEERYKINDHITQTIVMLDKVPLPKHLRNLPEIAGAHHETMDGKGYPRRLVREQMSWGARMMAVADIFEALTASDRPYKSSKTLSEALRIMEEFKRKNHIDEDVYNLFLSAGIPGKYAERCLKPEQNDLR